MSNKNYRINTSLIIAILSFVISLSTFIYNIYIDNKESLSLLNLNYECIDSNDGDYTTISEYLITNNSSKSVTIIDAYISYNGGRIKTSLDKPNLFPVTISPSESHKISVYNLGSSVRLKPDLFKLHVISSKEKHYSTKSSMWNNY